MTMAAEKKASSSQVLDAVSNACKRIAPNWPLDQLIAVNPWWAMRDKPMEVVAGELSWLAGVRCFLDPEAYRAQSIPQDVIARVLAEQGMPMPVAHFVAANPVRPATWQNLDQLFDDHRDLSRQISWREEIQHQLSQFAGRYFVDQQSGFYQAWLSQTRRDHGLSILMGEPNLVRRFDALPDTAQELLSVAMDELMVPAERQTDYAHALLLSLNGWASTAAYRSWQAGMHGALDHTLLELLAARLAWELVLWRQPGQWAGSVTGAWTRQLAQADRQRAAHLAHARHLHCWQLASERVYQSGLQAQLTKPRGTANAPSAPADAPSLQAVFCIDTRSEIMRRALEAQHPTIETRGFAGFFGLPIAYHSGAYHRPQLPGLLAPQLQVIDDIQRYQEPTPTSLYSRWLAMGKSPNGGFSLVESSGMGYSLGLLRNTFGWRSSANAVKPATRLHLHRDGQPLSTAAQADLALGILKAMGLDKRVANRVLLVGHGSDCQNNPHASALDCGACGGQTGEVNVRLLAQLLNDTSIRQALADRGLELPVNSRFFPALHNTTTDKIQILAGQPDQQIMLWLQAARTQCATERSRYLDTGGAPVVEALAKRARDWSQVRPEWGLANNACFIIAPRERTRHLDLAGRSFLHDYQWRDDPDNALLTQILTAPMLVTNWINMQYNASVTEPFLYGAGNKTLHNIVGGSLGVFEGNGGDLRIGLPLQSVHNGTTWMHQPLRLSVYVNAPRAAIARIVAAHDEVRWLVDNQWLYLFQLTDAGACRFFEDRWAEPDQAQ
ncbi:DUF2309 domain-containing protein [Halopseudomonas salina]|uniref:Probable inorganic carbon transporter subunit DabA n=1 Tax=Halopseudomonas salina TaxID=1323744 RepID=A0ABQ1NTF2_9GAMM|nr:DUF2309 domain-containing protein [Halopseudomonas salina]GGC84420.1 UPF0753 protein [Halopseudomonas salina]